MWIATGIWASGGVLGFYALVTWPPARRTVLKAMQVRVMIPEPKRLDSSEHDVTNNARVVEKGIFDFQANAFESIANIGKIYMRLTKDTWAFGNYLTRNATRFAKPKSVVRKVQLAEKLAKNVDRFVGKMRTHGTDLQTSGDQLSESLLALLKDGKIVEIEGHQALREFSQDVERFTESTTALRNSVIFAQQGLEQMKGYNQESNRAIEDLISVHGSIIVAIETIEAFGEEARQSITRLLNE